MKRGKNDPEGIRNRIVDAAFELFTTQGYGITSMQAVRDLAGVSSGALAHHFPAKHDLGLAVIRGPLTAAIGKTWVEPVMQAESARAAIFAIFEETISNAEQTGVVTGCPLGNLAAELSVQDTDFRTEMHRLYERWKQAIAARLEADQPPGRHRDRNADELADWVVAGFSGAMLVAKTSQTPSPIRSCLTQLRRLLDAETGG